MFVSVCALVRVRQLSLWKLVTVADVLGTEVGVELWVSVPSASGLSYIHFSIFAGT